MHRDANSSPIRPILVTGGLGFIGGHLVDRLLEEGVERIRVLDNYRRAVTPDDRWPADRVELIRGDIRDKDDFRHAVKGCELVFHLAAQSNVLGAANDPDYSCSTNVGGTLNVLVAAREEKVRRVVFTSSREVYGDVDEIPVPECAALSPKNLYGASKAAGEMYCRAFGGSDPEMVVLRLANVYGPRDQDRVIPIFLQNAYEGKPLLVYGGHQIVDFVWIGLVVDALLKVGLGSYVSVPLNIGSGVGTTILELSRRVLDLVSSNSACVPMPRRALEVGKFVADISLANAVLGLLSPGDPLVYLPQLVAQTRSESLLAG